jgi:RNA polymerase sigma-70 factor (ECF subfamily)
MNEHELRSALEQLHPDAHAWARSCCRGDLEDAEDVLQTVYLSVLDGHARFGNRASFRTWLFGVIRVTAAAQRRRTWMRNLLLLENADKVRPTGPSTIDSAVAGAERASRLRDALGQLSTRQRQVIELVFYHELTVEAAASVMGVSTGSARTHYSRGKLRLAELLADLTEG